MSQKAEKARALMYKRAALAELNYNTIFDTLMEITELCDGIRYAFDSESVIDALDGDEETEYEFRMMFSELSAEAEQLSDLLYDYDVKQYFDDFFVGIMLNGKSSFQMIGYDSYEEDYFALVNYERQWATNESAKRLTRLTKNELLSVAGQCFGVAMAYMNVCRKYDSLNAAYEIIKDINLSLLERVKEIDNAYNSACETEDWRNFDKLVCALPDKAWIE